MNAEKHHGHSKRAGVEQLPDGSIRLGSPVRPWWVTLVFAACFGTIAFYVLYLGLSHSYDRHFIALLVPAAVWLGVLISYSVGIFRRTFVIFSADSLTVVRCWPLGFRWKTVLPWHRVEEISMVSWMSFEGNPELRVRLDDGSGIRVREKELPLDSGSLLPEVLQEAPVPEVARKKLLAAYKEQRNIARRDPEATAAAAPPKSPGMEVLENAPTTLKIRVRRVRVAFVIPCVLAVALAGLVLALGLSSQNQALSSWRIALTVFVAAVALVLALHYCSWREDVAADRSGVTVTRGGLLWSRSKYLSTENLTLTRDAYYRQYSLLAVTDKASVEIGMLLTDEALGWLEHRLGAIWGAKIFGWNPYSSNP